LPLWEEAQGQFLSQIGTESLQELRGLVDQTVDQAGPGYQSKTIRLPVHLIDKISKMHRVALRMSEELGREPTDHEVAEEIGLSRSKVSQLKTAATRPHFIGRPHRRRRSD